LCPLPVSAGGNPVFQARFVKRDWGAPDETSRILAPHASTGMSAESMKLIVVRPLLIDAGGTI
jgi:hypothetical protein